MNKSVSRLIVLLFIAAASAPSFAVSTKDFFRSLQYSHFVLNPAGNLVAAMVREEGKQLIRIIDIDKEQGVDAVDTSDLQDIGISRFMWTDNNTLLVELNEFDRGGIILAVDMRYDEDDKPSPISSVVTQGGIIVDPLIDEEDEFVVGFYTNTEENDARKYSYAFRMNAWKRNKLLPGTEVAKKEGHVIQWFTNNKGEVRATVVRTDKGKLTDWYFSEESRRWIRFWNDPEKVEWFSTAGVVSDAPYEVYIIGQSVGRDTDAVYKYRFTDDNLVELFSLENFDVDNVLYNWQTREVIGATYYENGVQRHHYFEKIMQATHQALEKIFKGESIEILGLSTDYSRVLFNVHSFTNPGTIYLFDRATNQAMFLDEQAPWLNDAELQGGETGSVLSNDGLNIPYFLTLPKDTGKPVPMVVMPHGGPINVQDKLVYSARVQFLAANGYAVLQVNYRGSSGYGNSFLGAGAREWGEGIEQDIETVVQHVLQTHPIDSERLAIMGGSYGGYSALMAVSSGDNRYKCAVSFAGVTDLALMFSTSDWNVNESSVNYMKRLVGDPYEDYETLASKSPVYRADKITVPVLIVHGDKDQRVDIEHAWRMRLALERHGKQYDWLLLENEAHGIQKLENRILYYDKIVNFLDQNLQSEQADLALESNQP